MLEIQKDTLNELSEVSQRLNSQTTELNNEFIAIERKLCGMRLGVSGWASKLIGVKPETGIGYKFGFCRVGREGWKLVCRKIYLNETDVDETSFGLLEPITAMPRAIRLEASGLINEVIEDLAVRAKSFSADVGTALDNLNHAGNSLEVDQEKSNGQSE